MALFGSDLDGHALYFGSDLSKVENGQMIAWLSIVSFAYLGLLFLMAGYFEKRIPEGRLKKYWPYVYPLSLAVYCTGWTYYGSVGRAVTHGMDFLLIYLGPTLAMFLWWQMTRKLIIIKNREGIGSLADFISSRYGKSAFLGKLITILCIVAVLPYISLQIKSVSESFTVLTGLDEIYSKGFFTNPGFYVTLTMCLFTILYGTRYIRSSGPKPGLIATIAVESLIKLAAFLAVGIAALIFLLNADFSATQVFEPLGNSLGNESEWTGLLLVSFLAMFLLPRQFHMGVVEVSQVKNTRKAIWLFPLYLFLINLFVVPLAAAGSFALPGLNPDYYTITFASFIGGGTLAIPAFIGGLSAAGSMIIVSTLALGNMLSTWFFIPNLKSSDSPNVAKRILIIRRLSIVGILILAYGYYQVMAIGFNLVSIGVISFIAVSQFAPAFFGGLFWRGANKNGAVAGTLVGFTIWAVFFVLPAFANDGVFHDASQLVANLLGVSVMTAGISISLLLNAIVFGMVSSFTSIDKLEASQAKIFIAAMDESYEGSTYRGTALFPDIKSVLIKFLGNKTTAEVLDRYARLNRIDWDEQLTVDSKTVVFAERLLSEAIGPASARIVISNIAQEEEISADHVVNILEESQKVIELNRELESKSNELKRATAELTAANAKLMEFSDLKDEFLYTVAHELRTPLTSIRMQAEIIHDDETMPQADREVFLQNVISDCDRLTRLISNVLDLEKYESGSQRLQLRKVNLKVLLEECALGILPLIHRRKVKFEMEIPEKLPSTYLDVDKIKQVITNLLGNAIKFCDPIEGKILLRVERKKDALTVRILDNGFGIAKEEREVVFDKFYQVKNQTRKKPAGSGLGLAISQNVVRMHKGDIWIEEGIDNKGAAICFTLPLYTIKNKLLHAQDLDRG
jgi:signal transduction histidine kinase